MALKKKPDFTKEVYIDENTIPQEVIGKYAYNEHHDIGGIIEDGDCCRVIIGGAVYNTFTGDCFYDNLCINGFKVYELKK